MAVAQHQGIEAGGVDLQHGHVVEERLWLIAEIDQNVSHLAATPGLRVHGQPPLGDQIHARRCIGTQIAARSALDREPVPLFSRDPLDDLIVRYNAYRQAVDLRRL